MWNRSSDMKQEMNSSILGGSKQIRFKRHFSIHRNLAYYFGLSRNINWDGIFWLDVAYFKSQLRTILRIMGRSEDIRFRLLQLSKTEVSFSQLIMIRSVFCIRFLHMHRFGVR